MSKGQLLSSSLLIIFLFLNFSVMKSWSEGFILIAVTEEIEETTGSEEELERKSCSFDIILSDESSVDLLNIEKITNKNYTSFHDFKGTFFVPDFYSPPDYI